MSAKSQCLHLCSAMASAIAAGGSRATAQAVALGTGRNRIPRSNAGPAGAEAGGLFERVRQLEDAEIVAMAADDLDANG
jgi:hypothetical protein